MSKNISSKNLSRFFASDYLRLALLSGLAAAAGYAIAGMFSDIINPAVAGLTALVSIRPTFHDTAAEAVRQVVGTIIGAGFGLVLTLTMGYSPLAIFGMVVICFLVARLLKLGEEGAAVMGLTVILVEGPFFDVEMVESRFFGVVLGVLLALIISLWVRPGKPHRRALAATVKYANKSAALLNEISEYLIKNEGHVEKKHAKAWVLSAEDTMKELADIRLDTEAALKASRWSPLIKKQEAEAVLEQVIVAQVTARSAYGMSRDLLTSAKRGKVLPSSVAGELAGVIAATADTIASQAGGATNDPSKLLQTQSVTVQDWKELRNTASESMKNLDETQPIMLVGSILQDSQKIADALTSTSKKDTEEDN